MRIGDLAAQTGASVRALRYYEEQGLLSPQRTASDQRIYTADSVERVRLLRRLYDAGLTSKTIASLLPCVDSPSAAVTREALAVMHREHARISDQITELIVTRDGLSYLIDAAASFHHDQLAPGAATAPARPPGPRAGIAWPARPQPPRNGRTAGQRRIKPVSTESATPAELNGHQGLYRYVTGLGQRDTRYSNNVRDVPVRPPSGHCRGFPKPLDLLRDRCRLARGTE